MKVLICCDTGAGGERVLQEAQKLLSMLPAVGIYIHMVLDTSAIPVTPEGTNSSLIKALENDISIMQARAKDIFRGTQITFSDECGDPVNSILNKAASLPADMLILGTHGRTGIDRLLVGSIAESVLRNINCNTLVIPVKDAV